MLLRKLDPICAVTLRVVSLATLGIVLAILMFLWTESATSLNHVGQRFVTDANWTPAEQASDGKFYLLPMVTGTIAVTGGAVLLAVPLGIGAALFNEYYSPSWLALPFQRMIELLAGIPSVVFGFWGLVVLAPLIAQLKPPGPSLLAGILIVGMMILPTIMLVAQSTFRSVPDELLTGSAALGMGRWSIIWNLILPFSRSGLVTATTLGAARAIGETMAVVMVCGNAIKIPGSPFDSVRTLTANIALEMGYALGDHRSSLFLSGLVLMAICTGFIAVSGFMNKLVLRNWLSLSTIRSPFNGS